PSAGRYEGRRPGTGSMRERLKVISGRDDLAALMHGRGRRARAAARALAIAPAELKTRALNEAAAALRADKATILAANAEDVGEARRNGQPASYIDRLASTRGASKPSPQRWKPWPPCPTPSGARSPPSRGRTASSSSAWRRPSASSGSSSRAGPT